MTPYTDSRLNHFAGRDVLLKQITRYDAYRVMFYRTNLLSHTTRMVWLLRELRTSITQSLGKNFDHERAELIALVHDDPEIITGDYQASYRTALGQEELDELDAQERNAIDTLARRFPQSINGYNYRELLSSLPNLNTPEAMVVKYLDKLDGFCEALHEIFAGNTIFVTPLVFRDQELPLAFEYYIPLLAELHQTFDPIKPLFQSNHPLVHVPSTVNFKAIARRSKPHSPESIKQKTGYEPYDAWKVTILKNASDEERKDLYVQKEYTP